MEVASDGQAAAFTAVSAKAGWSFQVTMTVSDVRNTRTSQSVVTLQILPSGAPLITLTSVGRAADVTLFNPGQSLQLVGTVSFDGINNSSAVWTVDGLGQGVSLAALALTPTRVVLTSSLSTVYLVLPPHSLPTGAQLTFALSCSSESTATTTTYITVTTNAPPTPGSFGLGSIFIYVCMSVSAYFIDGGMYL